LRFEVDGFTTATTRILTPQNASYTLAGIDLAQTFTAAQTFNNTVNLNNGFTVSGSTILNPSRVLSNVAYVNQDWIPYDVFMDLGSSSLPWQSTYSSEYFINSTRVIDSSRNASFAQGSFSSNVSVTGNITPGGLSGCCSLGSSGAPWATTYSTDLRPASDGAGNVGTAAVKYGAVRAYDVVASSNLWVASSVILNSSRVMSNVAYVNQDWLPYDTSFELGSGALPWSAVYGSSFYAGGTAFVNSSREGFFTTVTMTGANMTGTMTPSGAGGGSIGSAVLPYGSVYGDNVYANDSFTMQSGSSATIYVGSGNFYLRTFSGADASCSGVTNGWAGIRTDTDELQVCIGGATKKVSLL